MRGVTLDQVVRKGLSGEVPFALRLKDAKEPAMRVAKRSSFQKEVPLSKEMGKE